MAAGAPGKLWEATDLVCALGSLRARLRNRGVKADTITSGGSDQNGQNRRPDYPGRCERRLVNPSPKASLNELLQEIKSLRADIQELPERIAAKLSAAINHELAILGFCLVLGLILDWLYRHFWK
jgi:hypothetical protein